jgi:hypothetical protein
MVRKVYGDQCMSRTRYVKVKVTLRPTIGRSVHHGVEPHLGLMTRY